jgi:A/G-specific adenine glycosylase
MIGRFRPATAITMTASDPAPTADSPSRQQIRPALLRWYRKHHRQLPWRAAPGQLPNPYHVLVSEAMLQQTQVATVIPYFHRFIEAFPTVQALAGAEQHRVLSLWQGLGYYRRARNLHAAAGKIVDEYGGELPADAAALRQLPGVGDYTAGAIASIAFNQPEPILDGNVARVLSRLFGIEQPIEQPAVKRQLWARAGELVHGRHPGDFNQGLMELGALVCSKKSPKCLLCPLAGVCRAYANGQADALPVTGPRRQPQAVTHRIVAVARGNRYLFEKRPDDGLWAGMWQLPTLEGVSEAEDTQAAAGWMADRFGLTVELEPKPLSTFTHQTTHRTIRFVLLHGRVIEGRLKPRTGLWRRIGQHEDLPLANPQHRALKALQ